MPKISKAARAALHASLKRVGAPAETRALVRRFDDPEELCSALDAVITRSELVSLLRNYPEAMTESELIEALESFPSKSPNASLP